jgi:DNA-binding LacI/PurR family transcriptional regulator
MEIKAGDIAYEKIERFISSKIDSGNLKAGDRLLSERELALMFKVSKFPVRRAMQKFIDAGLLERVHGKGTFVRRQPRTSAATGCMAVLFVPKESAFFGNSFYAPIVAGLQLAAEELGCNLEFRSFRKYTDETPQQVLRDVRGRVDGCVVVDPVPDLMDGLLPALRELVLPTVVLNYEAPLPDLDSVEFDGAENARALTQMLISQGHNRIAFLTCQSIFSERISPSIENRLRGYRAALEAAGIPHDPALVWTFSRRTTLVPDTWRQTNNLFQSRPDIGAMAARLREFHRDPHPVTALVCSDDQLALEVLKQAAAHGLRVPADITVTGYDNVKESEYVVPGLTTVHVPLVEMGSMGLRRLVEKINAAGPGMAAARRIVLPGQIIERGSHRRVTEPRPAASLQSV